MCLRNVIIFKCCNTFVIQWTSIIHDYISNFENTRYYLRKFNLPYDLHVVCCLIIKHEGSETSSMTSIRAVKVLINFQYYII